LSRAIYAYQPQPHSLSLPIDLPFAVVVLQQQLLEINKNKLLNDFLFECLEEKKEKNVVVRFLFLCVTLAIIIFGEEQHRQTSPPIVRFITEDY
jgi:hypothetical protein